MKNPAEFSPLVLAYIGDAVFELMSRQKVIGQTNRPVNILNRMSRSIVNAASQSEMYSKLESFITEEELSIMRRGRNAKSYTKAKNQTVSDYRRATGVEALFGYLYLKEDYERLNTIFEICTGEGKNNGQKTTQE